MILFLMIKKMGSVRNKEDLEMLDKFVDTPLLKDEKLANTFDHEVQVLFYLGTLLQGY